MSSSSSSSSSLLLYQPVVLDHQCKLICSQLSMYVHSQEQLGQITSKCQCNHQAKYLLYTVPDKVNQYIRILIMAQIINLLHALALLHMASYFTSHLVSLTQSTWLLFLTTVHTTSPLLLSLTNRLVEMMLELHMCWVNNGHM